VQKIKLKIISINHEMKEKVLLYSKEGGGPGVHYSRREEKQLCSRLEYS
jgi:hypothetical protein